MQKRKSKNILIVGGSGFVGTKLISVLDKKNCLNIDKNPSPLYNDITIIKDIRNLQGLKIDKNYDCLVLLAAEHRDDVRPSSLYYDVNVEGTKNILKLLDELKINSLIFTSSVAIYGLNKNNPKENHVEDPFNHYGKSKWVAEETILNWYNNNPKEKSITIIRPTVIFGERNRGNVYNLFKQISSGKFMMIGKGVNKKSMAYVGNVAALLKNIIENDEKGYRIFNYADKPDLSMSELVDIISKKMNLNISKIKIPYILGIFIGYIFDLFSFITRKKLSVSSIRVKKFCATTQFDASKIHSVFKPPYSLKEGINKTLEYEFTNSKKDSILFYSE